MPTYRTEAVVDASSRLVLSNLPFKPGQRIEVVLIDPLSEVLELNEREWLAAASRSDAFRFLDDPAENLYSRQDGVPVS